MGPRPSPDTARHVATMKTRDVTICIGTRLPRGHYNVLIGSAKRTPRHRSLAGRSPYPFLQLKGHARAAAASPPLNCKSAIDPHLLRASPYASGERCGGAHLPSPLGEGQGEGKIPVVAAQIPLIRPFGPPSPPGRRAEHQSVLRCKKYSRIPDPRAIRGKKVINAAKPQYSRHVSSNGLR